MILTCGSQKIMHAYCVIWPLKTLVSSSWPRKNNNSININNEYHGTNQDNNSKGYDRNLYIFTISRIQQWRRNIPFSSIVKLIMGRAFGVGYNCMGTLTMGDTHEFITRSAELWNRWIRLSCYYNRVYISCSLSHVKPIL